MAKKFFSVGMMACVFVLLFDSCATMFNKQTTVSAVSGSNSDVTITENGSVVYQGPLPVTIDVNSSNDYVVQYTDKNGNSRILQLQKILSPWFFFDLTYGGWIIDLITGDVMVYEETTMLPIKYSNTRQGMLVDYIPDGLRKDFRIIGNIYK
jgi:hypothetical protein